MERHAHRRRDAGLQGLMLSPREVGAVRDLVGPSLRLVTPGIRPTGSHQGDQKRTLTPAEAIAAGADCLVVGRPIMAADDPHAAVEAICATIA